MKLKGSQGNKFIIDSYGWIEYFGSGKLANKYARHIEKSSPDTYLTPSVIIYEVYKKIRSLYAEEDAIKAIMHIKNYTTVVEIDTKLVIKEAETSIDERLPMADAFIRAAAVQFHAKIITSDPHFKDQENVIFIQ